MDIKEEVGVGQEIVHQCPHCVHSFASENKLSLHVENFHPEMGKLAFGRRDVLIVTTNDVPGFRVVQLHGDVFGLTVRARDYFSNFGAQLRTIVGGEARGYTKLLIESRNEARERLIDEAVRRGANAVLAMRFDCNEIGNIMTEIAAYGTAATIEPEGD
jgi:uncharacterized protein YbjQ (UPF0145 family)